MSDNEKIQGLWKIESMISQGNPVGHADTHWEFKSDLMQEIIPTYVDGGQWAAFVLDETTTPKHMDTTYSYERDGETITRTFKVAYELSGDTLQIGGAKVFGQYPETINDAYSTVTTLSRFDGPRPPTKTASGTAPILSPVLGTVLWSDDLSVWQGGILFAPDQKISVMLETLEADPQNTIACGEAWITWAKKHEADIRAYAAHQMTDLAEDWRDDDEEPDEITPETFAARIRLSEWSMGADGSAQFWYDDDEIFAGHVVVVSVSSAREFTYAQMMG